MKTDSINKWIAVILCIAIINLIASILFILQLPEQVPTHFDVNWVCDGYGSRWINLILAFLPFPIAFAPLFWKKHTENLKVNYITALCMELYLVGLSWMMLEVSAQEIELGEQVDPLLLSWLLPLFLSALFVVLGNYLPVIRPNQTIGIRVSWTLEDENCWRKTHRFAGRLWVISGLLMTGLILIALACGMQGELWTLIVLFEVITVDIAAPCIYAYLHRKGAEE
ncbi:MAG: SdpI family protein [Oscillospiraceae bacterium]|nr:SdpI family protein [Oscillospiraceae bacterium]